ncbi:MAG: cytidine deaminase [Candidatus Hermodarchaeota archaeon]|nr:cytidine deaminase [Candidatus Hermodarchaeota archaeon]
MPPNDEELITRARNAQKNAYAPFSQFKVGAALLTDNGKIYSGCNVENSTYGATNCAERTAIFTAVCDGARNFQKIVVVTDREDPVMPCGICRNVLFEFSPKMEIIAVGASGNTERIQLSALFPKGFRLEKKQEKEV